MFEHLVAELAAAQYGVIARFQLLELGVTDAYIRTQIRSGTWVRLGPDVYGFRGHKGSWERSVWIAYLAAGEQASRRAGEQASRRAGEQASVSHQTAAACYRVEGFPRRGVHLTVPHPAHQRVTGATVHQTRFLPPHHTVNFNGRRTTTLARTLVDLAPALSFKRLELAYEHAVVTDHLTYSKMTRTFGELATPGRRGMTKLARVLDERGPGFVAPATDLERHLFDVAALAGLPAPVRQHPLPGHHGVEGCVDGAVPCARLILEADGRRWHTRLATLARDLAREKQVARVGWDTLRFTYVELTEDREGSAATMRDVYEERLALLGGNTSHR